MSELREVLRPGSELVHVAGGGHGVAADDGVPVGRLELRRPARVEFDEPIRRVGQQHRFGPQQRREAGEPRGEIPERRSGYWFTGEAGSSSSATRSLICSAVSVPETPKRGICEHRL